MNHIDLADIKLDKGSHPNDAGGCVMWTGYVERNGYGKSSGRWVHRTALAAKLGRPVADGMDACHTCDTRLCVNPDHLYEGTRRQNMADITARGRHNKPRGETHWRAKLSSEAVRAIREEAARGTSHKAQARRLGVHPVTVSRIVRGIWRTEVAS